MLLKFLESLTHALNQMLRSCSCVTQCLSANQIIGLYRCRAFVNRQNTRITIKLSGSGFLDKSHAAMDLDTQGCDLE